MERQGTYVGLFRKKMWQSQCLDARRRSTCIYFWRRGDAQEEAVFTCIARDSRPLPGVSPLPWNHKAMIRPNKVNVIEDLCISRRTGFAENRGNFRYSPSLGV